MTSNLEWCTRGIWHPKMFSRTQDRGSQLSKSSSRRNFLRAAAGAAGVAAVASVAIPGTSFAAAAPASELVTRPDHPSAVFPRGADRLRAEPLNATVDCALPKGAL
ncbi:ubiquinol-cytochrome c reductase iron-sulfur subunit N-terminal domain-containing protein [Streptomyces sp. NPDC056534]|uniref:ubiquinol-cytochrome c reductase iron-sulfur subunit N-terminal domain-containing protein n=1 Tax=Streptomyces sp. NPDC056534 TaxID=3345857 RepID=UPI0036A4D0A9